MTGSHEVIGSIPISSTMNSETGLQEYPASLFGLYLHRVMERAPSPGASRHPLPGGEGLTAGHASQGRQPAGAPVGRYGRGKHVVAVRQDARAPRDTSNQSLKGWSGHSCLLAYFKPRDKALVSIKSKRSSKTSTLPRIEQSALLTASRLSNQATDRARTSRNTPP